MAILYKNSMLLLSTIFKLPKGRQNKKFCNRLNYKLISPS
jgi:hypothetical protein